MLEDRRHKNLITVLAPVLFLAVSVLVLMLVCRSGLYPDGAEVMHHIYRGSAVYQGFGMLKIDPLCYNGAQLMRYDPPLAAFFMAGCIALTGGDVLNGYLVYVMLLYFLGAMAWLAVGCRFHRPLFGSAIGLIWFFLPGNLYALFVQGDLAFSLGSVLFPLLIAGVYGYLQTPDWKKLLGISACYLLIALCSVPCALLSLLAMVIFLCAPKKWREALEVLGAMLGVLVMTGVWVWRYFARQDAITLERMGQHFQSLLKTLSPLACLRSNGRTAYYGLSLLLIALFGGACSQKIRGFWSSLVVILLTVPAAYAVFRVFGIAVPMLLILSVASGMTLVGLLAWKNLRKPIAVALLLLICVDAVPSFSLVYGLGSGELVGDRMAELQNATLIAQAQEITQQRLAFLDGGSIGGLSGYLVSEWGEKTAGIFGTDDRIAETEENVRRLNAALADGNFRYLFDRCMAMGCDSVIVDTMHISATSDVTTENLDEAAAVRGYHRVTANDRYRLYHMEVKGLWGTTAQYRAIGIGTAASDISLMFPAVQETDTGNLNDYSFEQLSRYDLVYLDGFTYDDRQTAEELILRLSEAGTRVVIAADGIPLDKEHGQRFLGVTCNHVTFTNGFPELDTVNGILNTDLFPRGHTKWETVYVEGLDTSWGTVIDSDVTLDFFGLVKNSNIVVIALDMPRFYGLTHDAAVGGLLSRAMIMSGTELPGRSVSPMTVCYTATGVRIHTQEDGVNTALAWHDGMTADREITVSRNLLHVEKGATELRTEISAVPIILLAVGCLMNVLLFIRTDRRLKSK